MSASPTILCLAPNWIGDAVLALPALQSLVASGAPLHLVARPGVHRVLQEVQGDVQWSPLPSAYLARVQLALELRPRSFDAALLLTPSFSAAGFARIAGARVRVGEAADARRLLLTHPLPRIDRNQHLSRSYVALVEALRGICALPRPQAAGDALPSPRLQVRDDERRALRRLPDGVAGSVVVAPGARFGPAKQYPPERFAAAARSLAERWNTRVVLVGAAADAAATAAVHAVLPEAIDLTGRTDLGQLLAVLETARVTLANDSGTMHLAAAVGGAVVGVFGSTNPRWTAPLGPRATHIVQPVHCAPCYARHCREDFACMLQQSPESLAQAAQEVAEKVTA